MPPRRLVSLDVLRGLAILLMILSGTLPKSLPNWVDHGYQPHYRPNAAGAWVSTLVNGAPPFDARWKAFTWVDLVFPMFLFAMGAAIPFALARRASILGIVGRTLALIAFAVVVAQMTMGQINWPGATMGERRWLASIGFAGAFALFVRWRRPILAAASRLTGAAIIVAVIWHGVARGATFRWGESDTIMLVLATCYGVAAILWTLTRDWGWQRLLAVGPFLLLVHYVQFINPALADWRWLGDGPLKLDPIIAAPARLLDAATYAPDAVAGWTTQGRALANLAPLWNVAWLKYLWVVVPGTIVGDAIARSTAVDDPALPRRRLLALSIAIVVAACVGLRHYGFAGTPYVALALVLPPLVAMHVLIRRSSDPLARELFAIGAIALLIGIALACWPDAHAREGFFEGGISKGPPATLSYYATSVGLCTLLLLGLLVTLDDPARATRATGIAEANGQNPLLAYYLSHAAIGAILSLELFAPINRALAPWPWIGAIYGTVRTAAIGAIVWQLTRRRVIWRA